MHSCAMRLLAETGRTGEETGKLPSLYVRHSVDKGDEFLEYVMAVIYVESRFNRNALSDKQAYGLMQMTAPAVFDAMHHCRLKPVFEMESLFDSATNVRYGTCYLRKLLTDFQGNWKRALITYNGGYRQLEKYDKGEAVVTETANYVLQVERARDLCRK